MRILNDISNVYRKEGLLRLFEKGLRRSSAIFRKPITIAYWQNTKSASISVFDKTLRFHAEYPVERRIIWYLKENEKRQLKRFGSLISNDDVVYDIGANIGCYSCVAASLTDAEVHSFEPQPANAKRIRENFELNQVSGTVHEIALSDSNGSVDFSTNIEGIPGYGHGVIAEQGEPETASRTIEVQQRQIDQIIAEGRAPPPTIMKVDVEGSESLVLDGMKELLESSSLETIFMEIHKPTQHRLSARNFGSSEQEIMAILEGHNFQIETLSSGIEHHIIATRESNRT
jgi:FkbM family methyltransferase